MLAPLFLYKIRYLQRPVLALIDGSIYPSTNIIQNPKCTMHLNGHEGPVRLTQLDHNLKYIGAY